jgi:membrane fusion protein, multidrug efflux system
MRSAVEVRAIRRLWPVAFMALALAGCGESESPAGPRALPVKAMAVIQREAVTYKEYVGQVQGSREVEIRARVSGILTGKYFQDGSLVTEGQRLFSIDPREYRAQVSAAQAQLASAQAAATRAKLDVSRYTPLVAENAISRQVYDNAVAAAQQTQAQVEALKASLDAASLGLEYAEVTSPLTGRIGAADVFEGGLVTAGQTLLATVSSDNPVWVYFNVSERDLLDFQRRYGTADLPADSPARKVRLTLTDDTLYPIEGTIDFGDRALDSRTSTYRLRADFPNPDNALKPGLFARIRVTGESLQDALMVPERAVIQQLGSYFVIVVDAEGKAAQRPVKTGPRVGTLWVIEKGLAPGDMVVVEGIQKARPGTPLQVTPVTEADLSLAPAPAAGG